MHALHWSCLQTSWAWPGTFATLKGIVINCPVALEDVAFVTDEELEGFIAYNMNSESESALVEHIAPFIIGGFAAMDHAYYAEEQHLQPLEKTLQIAAVGHAGEEIVNKYENFVRDPSSLCYYFERSNYEYSRWTLLALGFEFLSLSK